MMDFQARGIFATLYWLCWTNCSIPESLTAIAALLRIPLRDLTAAWPLIRRCFEADPARPGRLIYPRHERERSNQADRREKARLAGGKGGRERVRRQASLKQTLEHGLSVVHPDAQAQRQADSSPAPASASASANATLPDGSSADARARDDAPLDDGDEIADGVNASGRTPVRDFTRWFYGAAISAGVVDESNLLDIDRLARRPDEIEAAHRIITTKGREVCEAQAHRMFASTTARRESGKSTRRVTVAFLADGWELFDARPPATPPVHDPEDLDLCTAPKPLPVGSA
jgi:hypothetical protein